MAQTKGDEPAGSASRPSLGPQSERVVVDELFDNGTVRLLRSRRKRNKRKNDFSITAWGWEREDIMETWRVEAFVGFTGGRTLAEGDVFFVADGSELNDKYEPIPLKAAQQEHLLMDWDDSREMARKDIKEQFYRLAATQVLKKKRLPAEVKKTIKDRVEAHSK
jgi:hypothetical protein